MSLFLQELNISRNGEDFNENSMENDTETDDDSDGEPKMKLKRSQYTLDVLCAWYHERYSKEPDVSKPKITIIIPNAEEFKPTVLQDLVTLLR